MRFKLILKLKIVQIFRIMESISVGCLNIQKHVKGVLLTSGLSTLDEADKSDFNSLTSSINSEQTSSIRNLLCKIKDAEKYWTNVFMKPEENKTSEHKRRAVFVVKNIQPPDTDYQHEYFIDEVFGLGEVTELNGPSGSCKSQIALQLCLNVQTPEALDGVEGEALYIDTCRDFIIDRLEEMAACYKMKLMKVLNKDKELEQKYKDQFTEEKILERVHYYEMNNDEDQTKLLFSLEKILKHNKKLKLIVFDTFQVFIKKTNDSSNYNEKKRITQNIIVLFQDLARKYDVSIVLLNGLRSGKRRDGTTKLEPNHGDVLFQSVTNRVSLDKEFKFGDDTFRASLQKGSIFYMKNSTFTMHFRIKESGVSSELD